MGSMSIWHWLILLVIVLLLFGAGKVPKLMGDMAKGIKAFKEGMKEATSDETPKPSDASPAAAQVPPPEIKKDTAKV
ncbi:MAG TPA: twin-arginine translocase TatA/TatE family subunit [Alphaproteobacteria bacterium]